MKPIRYIILCIALLGSSCGKETVEPAAPGYPPAPEGMRAVTFSLPGVVAGSPKETRAPATRAADDTTLAGLKTEPLKDGTTIWVLAEDITEDVPENDRKAVLHSYVVRDVAGGQMLYPCTVDDSLGDTYTETHVPMFLTIGRTYRFRAVAPARRFATDEDGGILPEYGIYVPNKEYLMATDGRYVQTAPTECPITDDGGTAPVQVVTMNPLIHQTAQLEFTIYPDPDSPGIFALDVLPQGVEISGLQNEYPIPRTESAYNWSLLDEDYLKAELGSDQARIRVRRDSKYKESFIEQRDDGSLYIRCPVLPTDAFSSSVIVVFNISVNGNPSQYSMMLNQKMFRSAYTYHYKGRLSIEDGVTVISWQYVYWGMDVPIIPKS